MASPSQVGMAAYKRDPNTLLRAYHDLKAKTDDADLEKHKKIGKAFVEGFCHFVSRRFNLSLEAIEQGSSFEGIKVGKPDEFDFLVVFLESDRRDDYIKEYPDPLAIQVDQYRQKSGKLKCYQAIMMPRQRGGSNPYQSMTGTWTDGNKNYNCLSARKCMEEFKRMMRSYKEAINRGEERDIRGIVSMDIAKSGYPNVKVDLELDDYQGTQINIDISPAVKFDRGGRSDDRYEYYIAKKHPQIKHVRHDHLEFLWLSCFSPQEQNNILRKKEFERENYRIVKSLLRGYVPNAYIWKTIFMLADETLPKKPLPFMYNMIGRFDAALSAELIRRGHEPQDCQDSSNLLLISRFNQGENVLARFNDVEIRRWSDQFKHLRKLLDQKKYEQFFQRTIDSEEIIEIANFARRY